MPLRLTRRRVLPLRPAALKAFEGATSWAGSSMSTNWLHEAPIAGFRALHVRAAGRGGFQRPVEAVRGDRQRMGKNAPPSSPKLCDVSRSASRTNRTAPSRSLFGDPLRRYRRCSPSCRYEADRLRGLPSGQGCSAIVGGFPGQAMAGVWRFWRGRRLRGALAAVVVDPGLRPRFFSVLPRPANFRSR
jgi:hypothetical protein